MRSLVDIVGKSLEAKLYGEGDPPHIVECARISLERACRSLADRVHESTWARRVGEYIGKLPGLIMYVDNAYRHVDRPELETVCGVAKRVSIMITGVLSILDRYAATKNRSCSEAPRYDRDVLEYLSRRESVKRASEALRSRGFGWPRSSR